MSTKYRIENVDEIFLEELKKISAVNHSVSGYPPSVRRLTKAIRKHSLWERIKKDIGETKLEDDRRKNE